MRAEACALSHGSGPHNVKDEGAVDIDIGRANDGSVEVRFITNKVDIHLHGGYRLCLSFTAAEIDEMYRKSLTASIKGDIEGQRPRPEVAPTSFRRR